MMYIILVYDIGEKRVGKMLKTCRKYLNWIQNSVFEGSLTDAQLRALLAEATQLMDLDYDSIVLFKSKDERWLNKEVIGVEKGANSNFL